MSGSLIIITGVIYAVIAVDQFAKGQTGLGIAYAGYSAANVGLWMMAR